MSTDRLGELSAKALPHIIRTIAEDPQHQARSQAALSRMAKRRFDEALELARHCHTDHPHEDDDLHKAHLLEGFVRIGVPALEALPIVEELVGGARN